MQQGTYVSIWGFVAYVLADNLDVYAEWETFNRHGIARKEEESERKEIFLEYLQNAGKVSLPNDEEAIPEKIEMYFDWAVVPTSEDIQHLALVLRSDELEAMSAREKEIFASGYRQPIFEEFSRVMYFAWLGGKETGSLEDKKMTIFRSWMGEERRKAIEKQGFTVQPVFSTDPKDHWHMFAYTIGATAKLGCEIILVNGGKDGATLLSEVVKEALDNKLLPEGPFTLPSYTVNRDALRCELKDIALDSVTAQGIKGKVNDIQRVKQLFIADKHNILPSEEGYDEGFVQALTSSAVTS